MNAGGNNFPVTIIQRSGARNALTPDFVNFSSILQR